MIVQPPAEAGIAQERVAEGIEQDAPHVALVDRADWASRRVQNRKQTQCRVALKEIDRLAERPAEPDRRRVGRKMQVYRRRIRGRRGRGEGQHGGGHARRNNLEW